MAEPTERQQDNVAEESRNPIHDLVENIKAAVLRDRDNEDDFDIVDVLDEMTKTKPNPSKKK